MSDEEMMKAWEKFMTPGETHKFLASSDGHWKGIAYFWSAPGTEPTKGESNMSNTMVMGERYQKSVYKGVFNNMPFEGEGTTGYDNARKIFVNTWIDNMGTGIVYMEGAFDSKKSMIHFSGTQTDPMTGKVVPVSQDFEMQDETHIHVVMYGPDANGKLFKTMEILFEKAG